MKPAGRLIYSYKKSKRTKDQSVRTHLQNVQLYGNTRYQQIFYQSGLTKGQEKVLREALYGLSVCEPEEVIHMKQTVRNHLMTRARLVQKVLNKWRTELVNDTVNPLLKQLFPKSKVAQVIISECNLEKTFIDFKEMSLLGVSKKMIAERLVQENILPKNFLQLS